MTARVVLANLIDYYAMLEVEPTARASDIRNAFKRLVLESHPDKNPSRTDWSERRIRELIEAFEVLSDPKKREEYDRRREIVVRQGRLRRSTLSRSRRDSSRERVEPWYYTRRDPEARAALILNHLLQGRAATAVRLLGELEARLGASFLREHLERPDYLDCLFLLGEYYLGRREYALALDRLRTFYRLESETRFPRHYLDQVVDMLKDIYLRKLPRWAAAEDALEGLREAETLELTRAEESLRLRRLIEILVQLGKFKEARAAVDEADQDVLAGRERQRMERFVSAAGRRAAGSC